MQIIAAACSLLVTSALTAQTPAKPTLSAAPDTANPNQQFTRAAQPGGVAISPDGTTVAWTLRSRDGATLHLTDVANPANDKLVKLEGAHCSFDTPVWSPSGETLAFLSNCTADKSKPEQEQIFLWSKASGEAKQLTHVTGNLAQPAWSPDGKSIAFLFVENATRHAGALDAMPPWNGVIGEDGVEIQRVYSVSTADRRRPLAHSRPPACLRVQLGAELAPRSPSSPPILPARTTGGSPSSTQGPSQDGDPRVILDPVTVAGALHGLQIAVPRFSPDGKRLSFIGGLMSDQGSTGGDVWVIDADGKHPVDATPNIDGTPTYAIWTATTPSASSKTAAATHSLVDWDADKHALLPHGEVDLGEVSVSGGAIKNAVPYSPANGGTVAFVKSSFTTQPEVWTLDGHNELHQLTHVNAGRNAPPYKFESIEWQNEGFHVQGWLTYPKNYDPSKKYPLIVEVHGGPSASAGPRGGTQWAELGYFDFQPNPRGSFGQGEELHRGQPQGLRLRRPPRHPQGHGCHRSQSLHRQEPRRHHRLELRRLHDHVRRHADPSLPCRRRRRRHLQLAVATTAKTPSTSG